MSRSIIALLAAATVYVAGCGGEKTYPVAGKVVWANGKAATELAGGNVSFHRVNPPPDTRKRNTMGEIQPDATFTLHTGIDGQGAPAAEYQVAIMPKLDASARNYNPSWLDKRFLDYKTSELKVTVEPKANEITIELDQQPSPK